VLPTWLFVMCQSDRQVYLLLGTEAGSVGPLNLIGEVGGAAERRQSMPIKLLVNGNQELLAESL